MKYLFSPNSSWHLRSDAHQSQIIGGDADVDHTLTIGGDTVKLLGGYIPTGFRHPYLWIPIFRFFGLTRPGIEPQSTVIAVDALSIWPLNYWSDFTWFSLILTQIEPELSSKTPKP